MRLTSWFLVPVALAGIGAAGAASASQQMLIAQTPAPGLERERAPGVPIAPQGGVLDRRLDERDHAGSAYRTPRDQRARAQPRDPDRNLPMPRGVPSIIAP
jgi:hypothetical protein